MLKVERVSTVNWENAIRGARNPMNSWARMDSYYNEKGEYVLGENDLSLASRLAFSGSDHRKFLRQIIVSMDIPLRFIGGRNLTRIRSARLQTQPQRCIRSRRRNSRARISHVIGSPLMHSLCLTRLFPIWRGSVLNLTKPRSALIGII